MSTAPILDSPAPALDGADRPGARYVSSYTELAVAVRASGLMRRRHAFYWSRIVGTVVTFVGIWVAAGFLGDSWWQLGLAALLAVVSTQIGFLGHDGAHRQIFDSIAWNEWTARILAGGLGGLSLYWWRGKHNKHHKAPNQIGSDPDIRTGALTFIPYDAATRPAWVVAIVRRQGWFFFPLLSLEGGALHVASIRTLLADRTIAHRGVELGLICTRLIFGVVMPYLLMPAALATAFIALQLALFGLLLGGSFAPNHKGMPIVPENAKVDFLRRQVLMSRNVRGGPLTDFMMGGLNYQIEHHLFPSMPRANLRRVRPMVREHCARYGVTYTETGLLASYALVVRYLNQVGLGSRDPFDCPLVRQYR